LMTHESPVVVMADDDDDDCVLAKNAFEQSNAPGAFRCIEDGVALLDYLSRGGAVPDLILLDLNMPRKDGRQALTEIKSTPGLRDIPLVVLTTSRQENDIVFSRTMGANSFITKPATFDEWVEMMKSLTKTWLA
jgi:CheY-like chemotaxis protein